MIVLKIELEGPKQERKYIFEFINSLVDDDDFLKKVSIVRKNKGNDRDLMKILWKKLCKLQPVSGRMQKRRGSLTYRKKLKKLEITLRLLKRL